MSDKALLEVRSLSAGYDASTVVRDVSLRVKAGEVVSLIGANGAGKSTFVKAIVGAVTVQSGDVLFEEELVTAQPPHVVAARGLALSPEGAQVFPSMTVLENLLAGHIHLGLAWPARILLEDVFSLFPILDERRQQAAGTLSGGERQMLAIGRALMSRPKLLILDEPSLGLAAKVTQAVFDRIRELSIRGQSILLVEQNVREGLAISDRGCVMANGTIVLDGTADSLLKSHDIHQRYFGA